jgi:hypothetical protein
MGPIPLLMNVRHLNILRVFAVIIAGVRLERNILRKYAVNTGLIRRRLGIPNLCTWPSRDRILRRGTKCAPLIDPAHPRQFRHFPGVWNFGVFLANQVGK